MQWYLSAEAINKKYKQTDWLVHEKEVPTQISFVALSPRPLITMQHDGQQQ